MVVAAEQSKTQQFILDIEAELALKSLIISVPELAVDKDTRAHAARFIGAVALNGSIEAAAPLVEKPIESLHDAIQKAAKGDHMGRRVVEINARTDVIERTIKVGHVTAGIPLFMDENKKIIQYGQTMDSIQANSLRVAAADPIMRPRTEAETRNAFRIEQAYREGRFEDYSFVVISRAENIPGMFFTDTMSCSIQLTAKAGSGLAMESAFVAGVKQTGEATHDEATVIALGTLFGVNLEGKTPAEIIDTPFLIHNSLIPNGVIDIVQLYDICAGGTFFGEKKPVEDYMLYRQKCLVRELGFKSKVDAIVNELIKEAQHIATPIAATQRLHKISEKHMVEYAVEDETINPRVFGETAAGHIEMARWHNERGNTELAQAEVYEAISAAKSLSCPTTMTEEEKERGMSNEKNDTSSEDCEFTSRECPLCHAKNVKTKVSKIAGTSKKLISGGCGCKKVA